MKYLRTVGQVIFSAWVWISGFSWMFVTAVIVFVLLVLRFPFHRVYMRVLSPMFRLVPWLATIRVRVHYHPDFEPDRRSVFCQTHINLLDGNIAAAVIPHAFAGLMNAAHFKIPIYGWLMRLAKGIRVRRGVRSGLIEELSQEARKRKEIGMSILAFPEGHRTTTGLPGPFKRGVFLMARNAGMPVVPVAAAGLYEANNKNLGWRFRRFRKVDVFVGPQFETEDLADDEIRAFAERMRTYAIACMERREFPSS